jgi:hypothetical protein
MGIVHMIIIIIITIIILGQILHNIYICII